MDFIFILIAIIILLSIVLNKVLYRFGVPSLLIFLCLGMIFGGDGLGIEFDNYQIAEEISSAALIFIMFYGGFGTKWETAKPTAVRAIIMSSLGTVVTALITGVFCSLVLKTSFLHGLLVGSVLSSTDAASVFSILRSRKLNLRDGLAPLLEIESGSNDPFAYMMTIICITLIKGGSGGSLVLLTFTQITFGILVGIGIAVITIFMLKNITFEIEGFHPLILISAALLGFGVSSVINGNGFLCVYIIGILVGNSKILHKVSLVHFFDAFSWIMQILLFFMLGLLAVPTKLLGVFIPGLLIAVVMIVIARPIATVLILHWFKVSVKAQLFVSWVGLRGAASIVFAIISVSALGNTIEYDIFHIVFFVALFSVIVQGTLTPYMAKKLRLVNKSKHNAVLKTFNDYREEGHGNITEYMLQRGDEWADKMIVDTDIPGEILIAMVKRKDKVIVPKGSTMLLEGDILVLCSENISAIEKVLER